MAKRKPDYVPSQIRLADAVSSDLPAFGNYICAPPGDYTAMSNQWGAVSVVTPCGKPLGIKPQEFEVLEPILQFKEFDEARWEDYQRRLLLRQPRLLRIRLLEILRRRLP